MTRTVTIYALCEPTTNEIRYIGQSVDPSTRIKAHIGNSFTGTSKRDKWIRSLLINGQLPTLQVLSVVALSEADTLEVDTIKRYRQDGCNLLNGIDRANGSASRPRTKLDKAIVNISLGSHARTILKESSASLGISQAAVMELALRQFWTDHPQENKTMNEQFTKTIADYAGFEEPYGEMADDRVAATPELQPYRDLLIDSDWDNQGEHWEWVATADVEEILDWAKDIRANQPQ